MNLLQIMGESASSYTDDGLALLVRGLETAQSDVRSTKNAAERVNTLEAGHSTLGVDSNQFQSARQERENWGKSCCFLTRRVFSVMIDCFVPVLMCGTPQPPSHADTSRFIKCVRHYPPPAHYSQIPPLIFQGLRAFPHSLSSPLFLLHSPPRHQRRLIFDQSFTAACVCVSNLVHSSFSCCSNC